LSRALWKPRRRLHPAGFLKRVRQSVAIAIGSRLQVAAPGGPHRNLNGRPNLSHRIRDLRVRALPLAPVARALAALVQDEAGGSEDDEDDRDDYACDDGGGFVVGFRERGQGGGYSR